MGLSPNSCPQFAQELWWQKWMMEVAQDFGWQIVEPVECVAEIPAVAPWLRQPSQLTSQRRPLLRYEFVAFYEHAFPQLVIVLGEHQHD